MKAVIDAKDAPVGSVIQVVEGHLLTARRYKVLPTCPIIGSVTALDLNTGIKVQVADNCQVFVAEKVLDKADRRG